MNKRSSILVVPAVLITFTLLMMVPNLYGSSFRCGTKLVQVGDKQTDVLAKCGPPTSQTQGRLGTGGGDRWTYNRGSTKSMVIVRFVGGKVSSIENASRGFVQPTFQED